MAEEEADERWDDWEEDEDPVQSLLCPVIFPSAKAALRSDADDFDFDLKELIGKMGLDVYGGVKAVNYVRSRVKELGGTATKAQALEIKQALLAGALDGSGDELLLPVLENDALLCSLDEMLTGGDGVVRESGDEVAALEAEIESLKEELVQARALVQQVTGISEVDADDDPDSKDVDTYYFDSYGKIGIHEEMLRDKVRTGGYQRAIMSNPELFRGRTVLDVGCGTGVLSMFAAKAGAKRVIGVDMSDMIDHARKLVEINGFSDVVTLLKGKVEEVKLPVKEVSHPLISSVYAFHRSVFMIN
jgi:protein arginine N-methyltransferase 3